MSMKRNAEEESRVKPNVISSSQGRESFTLPHDVISSVVTASKISSSAVGRLMRLAPQIKTLARDASSGVFAATSLRLQSFFDGLVAYSL